MATQSQEIANSNLAMVDEVVGSGYIENRDIERAFRLTDRGLFYTSSQAYTIHPVNSGQTQSLGLAPLHISAPVIYAQVLRSLKVKKGETFLNVGSGTGYFSTIVGYLLGAKGRSHGIEMFKNLITFSKSRAEIVFNSAEAMAFSWCKPEYFLCSAYSVEFLTSPTRYDKIYVGASIDRDLMRRLSLKLNIGGVMVTPSDMRFNIITRLNESLCRVQQEGEISFNEIILTEPNPSWQIPPPLTLNSLFQDSLIGAEDHIRELASQSGIQPFVPSYIDLLIDDGPPGPVLESEMAAHEREKQRIINAKKAAVLRYNPRCMEEREATAIRDIEALTPPYVLNHPSAFSEEDLVIGEMMNRYRSETGEEKAQRMREFYELLDACQQCDMVLHDDITTLPDDAEIYLRRMFHGMMAYIQPMFMEARRNIEPPEMIVRIPIEHPDPDFEPQIELEPPAEPDEDLEEDDDARLEVQAFIGVDIAQRRSYKTLEEAIVYAVETLESAESFEKYKIKFRELVRSLQLPPQISQILQRNE